MCCRIKSGLFGITLKSQAYVISLVQMVSSFALIIVSSVMLSSPNSFIDIEFESETTRQHRILEVGENGTELLIASITTLIASILLLRGLRRNSTGLILPWIVVNIVDISGGLIIFITKLANPSELIKPAKITAAIVYFILSFYFVLSIYAYYKSLKRQKKLAKDVLKSNSTLDSEMSISHTELRTFPSSRPPSLETLSDTSDDEFILYVK